MEVLILDDDICEYLLLENNIPCKQLGKGNFGRVYLAKGVDGKDYAIKVVDENRFEDREWENTRSLKGKSMYLMQIFAKIKKSKSVYLKMEYVNCKLKDCIDDHRCGGLNTMTVNLMWQLLKGVSVLHGLNLIHRDIKLDNILLNKETDESLTIKLTDYGLTRVVTGQTQKMTICGTPLNMAPEILEERKYSNKVDVWSVGVIFYELITSGTHPFANTTDMKSLKKKVRRPILRPPCLVSPDAATSLFSSSSSSSSTSQPSPAPLISFSSSSLPLTSASALDAFWEVLSAMLQYDPHNRPSVEEVMRMKLFVQWGHNPLERLIRDLPEEWARNAFNGFRGSEMLSYVCSVSASDPNDESGLIEDMLNGLQNTQPALYHAMEMYPSIFTLLLEEGKEKSIRE